MIPFETASLFFAASLALAIAPGPDNIFLLTQSALHGRAAGILAAVGLCTGLLVHTAAVALGVAALFHTSALAFTALKGLGALYLLYLAWRAFRAGSDDPAQGPAPAISARRLYARGVIMNVANPKVAIFFLAFLPQFADPSRGPLTVQILLLGALFMAAAVIVFGALALGAGSLGGWLKRSPRGRVVMNRLAGLVFLALAVRLAVTQR